MADFKASKVVAALPAVLEKDTVYFVKTGDGFDVYVTNGTGDTVAYPLNIPVQPPVGVQVNILPASEALDAGDFVNIFDDAGTAKVRKADNSNGRSADGFVTAAVTGAADATVHPLDGVNAAMTALSPGKEYWLGTAGDVIETPLDETDPLNANKISQQLGKALSATELRTDDYGYVIL